MGSEMQTWNLSVRNKCSWLLNHPTSSMVSAHWSTSILRASLSSAYSTVHREHAGSWLPTFFQLLPPLLSKNLIVFCLFICLGSCFVRYLRGATIMYSAEHIPSWATLPKDCDYRDVPPSVAGLTLCSRRITLPEEFFHISLAYA